VSAEHPLVPLIRELCPKRYPVGWPKKPATLALDAIEIYELACRLGARGVTLVAARAPDARTEQPPQ